MATFNHVKRCREARSLTRDDLATLANISSEFLQAVEEDGGELSVGVALRLAQALGVTVEELFAVAGSLPSPTSPETQAPLSAPSSEKKTTRKKGASRTHSKTSIKNAGQQDAEVAAPSSDSSEPAIQAPPYVPRLSVADPFLPEGDPFFSLEEEKERAQLRVGAPRKSQTISSYYSKTATVEGLASSPLGLHDPTEDRPIRFFDLFCGVGGFRYAAERVIKKMGRQGRCSLSCDVDPFAQRSYAANFGDKPFGDIKFLPSADIPDFDLLFAGFPCQTFSIIGLRKGFADETKGSLFFQIARILHDKRPRAFVLENVRQLTTHDGGRTFEVILRVLQDELGYYVDWRVLNALDCGLPQKRERVVIVGSTAPFEMEWPKKTRDGKELKDILEPEEKIPRRFYASPEIVASRKRLHQSKYFPAVWHENKSGIVSSYPYSCALRAGASHNYLLVNGERRFTPLELLRLQGFPDDFKVVTSYSQLRKQMGNAAPVNLVEKALERFLPLVFQAKKEN